MARLRKNLRIVATTWLLFQVAWLTALVPRDCCAAHRPAEKSCHESAAASASAMGMDEGTACPMHGGHGEHSGGHSEAAPPERGCRMSGACEGPMAALLSLLSYHGVLTELTSEIPQDAPRLVTPLADDGVVVRIQPPEPPPPRA